MGKNVVITFLVCVIWAGIVAGLATEEHGNNPVNKLNYTEWDGTEILAMLNDTNRVYSTWCNGNEYFYYNGNNAAANSFLKKCAEIKNARVIVKYKEGTGIVKSFSGKKKIPYTWNVNIRTGIAAAHTEEKKNKTVVITIFVDNKTIQRKNIKIPEKITLKREFQ
jgi:hypothetical protein